MRRAGWFLLVVACVLATVLLAAYSQETAALKHLDSVFLYESSLSVLESGHATSPTWESYVPEVHATFTLPANDVCEMELRKVTVPGYDVLDNHAYVAIYPISLLTAVTGPEAAFAILNALAHVLLIAIPFAFLLRQGAGIAAAMVFALLVAVYPAWSLSAVGDYYLDRLSMPLALLSLFTMHLMLGSEERLRDARWLAAWAAATIAAALFTERAALMMIGAAAFFAVAFPAVRRSARALATLTVVGLLLATYLWWYFSQIQSASTSISLAGSINTSILADRLASPQMLAFLAVNLAFMGPLVVLSGLRYAVLVVGSLIPNLVISVGGAELNGWETHYHAMYLPFVLFAATVGFLWLARRASTRATRALLVTGVAAYALVLGMGMDPATGGRDSPIADSLKRGVAYRLYRHYVRSGDVYAQMAEPARKLAAIVPPGSRVSTVEAAMPALYRGRSVSMYPMNMDVAEYVVAPGVVSDGAVVSLGGAVSYLGPEVEAELNACLLERARADGFELWQVVDDTNLVVLRRARGAGPAPGEDH